MTRLLKLLIFAVIFLSSSLYFSSPIKASNFMEALQSPTFNLESMVVGKEMVDPNAASGMLPIISNGLSSMILGSYDQAGNKIASGGVTVLADLTNSLYNNSPVSGVRYIAYMSSRFNIVPPAFAATPGQDFLEPMLDIWIINRDFVYVLFIVVFVVVGFMIMFRSKLNPQTIVNIQLALPKIIISLILVTFSYAISGFIVDLVFFFNKMVETLYAIDLSAHSPSGPITPEALDWLGIISKGFGTTFGSVLDNLAKVFSPTTLVQILGKKDFTALFNVIVAFTIFGITLKIFFTLLSKYVTLLIQAIFSPFIFLVSAFPSSQASIGSFLKSMLSAALAFPAVYFVFILANSILDLPSSLISLPPLNDIGVLNDIGGLKPYIALGILMTAPSIPQMIDGVLGVKSPGIDTSQVGGALRKLPLIGSLLG